MLRTVGRAMAGLVWVSALAAPSVASAGRGTAVARLKSVAPGALVRADAGRGTLRFAHLRGGIDGFRGSTDPATDAARFLRLHGAAFGLESAGVSHALARTTTDTLGHTRVDFDEFYDDVPVFGAGWSLHFDTAGDLIAVRGSAVPTISLSVQPRFGQAEAGGLALDAVPGAMRVVDVALYVFDLGLISKGVSDPRLAYRVVVAGPGQRHEVFVDAHDGGPLLAASQIHDVLERHVYEFSFAPGSEVWQESDGPYLGDDEEVAGLIDFTEDSYDLFNNVAGGTYPSFDGASAPMHGVVDAAINCPNANWDGTSTNYCLGLATDDVVGHEWAHAYTQLSHGLIYAYQPGALNESFSDIFGEAIDLLNGAGLDTPGEVRDDGTCSFGGDSVRWLIGEDTVGLGGAIRDMWNPACENHPGRIGAPDYACTGASFFDNGGVHINSGVSNHAFALLVDGGTYNGQEVTAIGMTKALALYWRAMTVYQDVTSGFADHADALVSACNDLRAAGSDLPSPVDGAASGEVIGAADCDAVDDAIAATQMLDDAGCGSGPLLDTADAPDACPDDSSRLLLEETFETDLSVWTLSNEGVTGQYTPRDWELRDELPSPRTGQAVFANGDLYLGDCNDDNESGVMHLDSPSLTMPDGDGDVVLSFDHWVATQPRIDGGNLKISRDGGPFAVVPATAFTFNPYNEQLDPSGNPLGDEPAFSGSDPGVPTGSWATSLVDLRQVASPGEEFVLRFDFGVDACNGLFGWYVDDVRVLECAQLVGSTGSSSTSDSGSSSGSTGGPASTSGPDVSTSGPGTSTTNAATTTTTSATSPGVTSVASSAGQTGSDTGETTGEGAGSNDDAGCGCTQGPKPVPWAWLGLGCLGIAVRRRRAVR